MSITFDNILNNNDFSVLIGIMSPDFFKENQEEAPKFAPFYYVPSFREIKPLLTFSIYIYRR